MSNLADRLKSMGIQVGKDALLKPPRANYPIETVVEGQTLNTLNGPVFVVEKSYPLDYEHGNATLAFTAPLEMIGAWAKDERIQATPLEGFAFIDTETTGLAGGSGTYAFMIGAGKFEQAHFRLAQFFMRDPSEETALLAALEQFLAACQTIVSFNGKSFDLPLIQTRYITNGWPPILKDAAHLDLLHLARRLWRQRLPSRTLGYLEKHILEKTRSDDDTPGWMIPQMYFDYLRSEDARPLKGIFYHNEMDILSMVGLTEHMAQMLAEPLGSKVSHALDLVAVGKLHEDLGFWEMAAQILNHCLDQNLPPGVKQSTVKRLSYLHRRRGELPEALSLWWQAAAEREIYAHEELAKYYEHQAKDFEEAKRWTQAALAIINLSTTPNYERVRWEPELNHRLKRLEKKIRRQRSDD